MDPLGAMEDPLGALDAPEPAAPEPAPVAAEEKAVSQRVCGHPQGHSHGGALAGRVANEVLI